MSWGDDPDLQDNVQHLRKLLEQLEVGILWANAERNDARALTEFLCQQCRARLDACQGRKPASPVLHNKELDEAENHWKGG